MSYEVKSLIDALNENGIHVIADRAFDKIEFDFSEHDKMVAEKKDKSIAKLERENNSLKERFSLLRTRCKPGIEKYFDKWIYGKLAIVGCNEEIADIQNKMIYELEDRHQSDCIRINQLITTIDVLTERYQKLREIHGL